MYVCVCDQDLKLMKKKKTLVDICEDELSIFSFQFPFNLKTFYLCLCLCSHYNVKALEVALFLLLLLRKTTQQKNFKIKLHLSFFFTEVLCRFDSNLIEKNNNKLTTVCRFLFVPKIKRNFFLLLPVKTKQKRLSHHKHTTIRAFYFKFILFFVFSLV